MVNPLNKLIDYFIHPRLKVDKSTYEKSRVSAIAFIIVLFIIILYELFYLSNGYIWDVKAIHNYLGISTTLAGLILIKKTGKTNLALSCLAVIGVYLVTASIYMSGGIISNDILWYMVLATASFMFIGGPNRFYYFCFVAIGNDLFLLIRST